MHFADLLLKHELIGSGRKPHWCLNPPHSDCGVETAMAFLRSKRLCISKVQGIEWKPPLTLHQDRLLNHASNDRDRLKEPVSVKMWIVDLKKKNLCSLTYFFSFYRFFALLLQESVLFSDDYSSFNTFSFQHKSSYRSIFPWCFYVLWANNGYIGLMKGSSERTLLFLLKRVPDTKLFL